MPLFRFELGLDAAATQLISRLIGALGGDCNQHDELKTLIQNLEIKFMAKADELVEAFAGVETAVTGVSTEVNETKTEVGLLHDEITALKDQVAGNAALEAAVDSIITRASTVKTGLESASASLDSLQRKVTPPDEPPVVDENTDTQG